jgi:Cu/Ag efflux protein CusF
MKRPTKGSLIGAALLGGWMMGGTLHAQEGGKNQPGGTDQPQQQQQHMPEATASQLTTTSAKVQNVDMSKRELTLRSDDGRLYTVDVPQDVSGLENVRKGDRVDAKFYQSVAVSLVKPGEAPLGTTERRMGSQTGGALPGGTVGKQVTSTARITKIDPSAGELTIESQSGKPNTIRVDDPDLKQQMSRLKVGDKVQATYTEAMAAQISPAQRK